MAKLVVLSAGMTGRTHELKVDKTTIGRVEDNTFQIAEPSVSSHHCEVLLRMLDEQGELVPPARFIPAAEKYGLMPAIDRWVITNAFSSYASLATKSRALPIQYSARSRSVVRST